MSHVGTASQSGWCGLIAYVLYPNISLVVSPLAALTILQSATNHAGAH
jgi:hypothetical protein